MRNNRNNSNKLGHQAKKGWRINNFNHIHLDGDFAYCESHNFVYHPDVEEEKLYNAQPCYYTDNRFYDGDNFYHSCYLYNRRFTAISLKSCIKRILKCKNIPVGTIVDLQKSWYYTNGMPNNFLFKIRKENFKDFKYEINKKSYYKNFSTDEFSIALTNKLRENGFIVSVHPNTSFLMGMLNTAIAYTGKTDFVDSKIKGEIAVAYGHGKIIGYSSYDDDFRGYSLGEKSILFDFFGEFDKWSRCREIPKGSIDDVENIITELLKNKDEI